MKTYPARTRSAGAIKKDNPYDKDPERYKTITSLSIESKKHLMRLLQRAKRIRDSLKIIDFLSKNSVNYVVFKGLTLYYLDKDRKFYDMDIFVEHKDVKKVVKMLENKFNYAANKAELNYFKQGIGFHIELKHADMLPVEVHYFLFDSSLIDNDKAPILDDKQYIIINRTRIPCMSKEMQLINIFLHNVYNHGFIVDYKKWLDDVLHMVDNDLDWDNFLDLAKRLDASEIIFRTIRILNLFNKKNLKIPKHVMEELHKDSSSISLFMTYRLEKFFYKNYPVNIEEILKDTKNLDWKIKYSGLLLSASSLGFRKVIYLNTWKKNDKR